jgi:demethylmenaquinone methyltransferase/2-methoxy-6-polyprenyl-1,4-benzoquinol methylase
MEVAAEPSPEVLPPHPALSRYYQGSKRPFIRQIFDRGAADYDRVERVMALGSGSWYRRHALRRAGLDRGMKVLDVAIGTGLVAREEIGLVGDPRLVVGLDPSAGMLAQAKKSLDISVLMGLGEQLPVADGSFDFLSMGYALRHVSDLNIVFAEFLRALKPGGRLCVLELTRPRGRIKTAMLRAYMRRLVPALTWLITRRGDSQLLWQYYWETIESCIPPEQVLGALANAGFANINRHVELGIFTEYTATKPK